MITLNEIELPPYLIWEDEFTWTPVDQSTDFFLAGNLDIQVSKKLTGRHITLTGNDHLGWIPRSELLILQELSETPADMELNYHGREFTVRFRYDTGAPVTAEKIIPRIPPLASDPYRKLLIKFIEVG